MPSFLRKPRVVFLLAIAWASLSSGTRNSNSDSSGSSLAIDATASVPSFQSSPPIELSSRADALFSRSLALGSVSYETAAMAAYGMAAIPEDLISRKRQWRTLSRSRGFEFLSDYQLIALPTPVSPTLPRDHKSHPYSILAVYHASENLIKTSADATGFTLMHELGHSLQREAICHQALNTLVSSQSLDRQRPTSPHRARRRLQEQYAYLSSQDELEVRLQDLNRFHAYAFDQLFLLDALDAIKALSALGMNLSPQEVEIALATAGIALKPERVQRAIEQGEQIETNRSGHFNDARDLVVLRRITLRIDPEAWPALLAKLIYEAPGHF